eukprot:RCo011977
MDLSKEITAANPNFRHRLDAFAFALHCALRRKGFVAVDPNGAPVQPATALPEGWNSSSEAYLFRYRHECSSMGFVVKMVPLLDKLVLLGASPEGGAVHQLALDVSEYLQPEDAVVDFADYYKNPAAIAAAVEPLVQQLIPSETGPPPPSRSHLEDPPEHPWASPVPFPPREGGPRAPALPFGVGHDDLTGGLGRPPFGGGPLRGGPGGGLGGMLVGPGHSGFGFGGPPHHPG